MPAYVITLTTTEVLDVERTDQAAQAFLRTHPGLDPDTLHVSRRDWHPDLEDALAHMATCHMEGPALWDDTGIEDADNESEEPLDVVGWDAGLRDKPIGS